MGVGAALLVLALALSALPCDARVVDSQVTVDDRRLIPLTEAFGFANGGQLEFTISNIVVWKEHQTSEDPNLDNLGFFLSAIEPDAALEQDLSVDTADSCILKTLTGNKLPRFSDSAIRKVLDKKEAFAQFDFTIESGGQFYLYFSNCESSKPVSFDMHIETFNINSKGQKDYLSVGETELEVLYWVMFALFTVMTGVWCHVVWKNRAYSQRIHYLMALLGLFKGLTLMSQAIMVHFIERTGSADGWNIAFYIFTFFRGVLFFTVVVLIGTGWSYMKPFLGDREKRILMVVIPLQVFANIAIIVMDEEAPSVKDWFTWRDVFHLVDIICCCAILFPIVWSIKNLREASQTDGKAARNLEKLQLFRQFYVMVVVYIYFTRIVVYLLRNTVQYQYLWISEAADQLATLAFYVWVGVKFSPAEANPYLRVHADEVEMSSA
ncbi:hypothetical protein FOA52_004567 [Chlamydomonas sp. UWO 241]|nr:hypothetical protein FOA52_004567 [Chlamydomonas sp. UWO 241]